MYIRNDGKGESNITQNGFTAYLLSAVAHRKADYLHAKQRRQAREVLTDPDDLSTEEAPGISDPTDLLCCIENAALEEVLNRISERDRYIFFSRALHGRSFHELALELDLGYQGVAAAYHRVCKKVKEATGRDVFIILKIEVSFVRIEKNFKSQGINCYASRVPLAAWTASVLFL